MLALSTDGLGLGGSIVSSNSVSAELAAVAVKPAKVVKVGVVLREDWEEDTGTIVTGSDDIGAFAVANESSSDALQETAVVIGLAVSAANGVVVAGAVALSGARLHGQSDLLVAQENTVALVGGASHCANWLVFQRAVTGGSSEGRSPGLGRTSARAIISLEDLASLHSAHVSIGDTVKAADFPEFLRAFSLKHTVGVHDLLAISVMEEVDAGVLEGAKVGVGLVVVSTNFLVSPDTV